MWIEVLVHDLHALNCWKTPSNRWENYICLQTIIIYIVIIIIFVKHIDGEDTA